VALMPAAILPGQEVASANLGFVAFTLGALLTPSLVNVLNRKFGFRRGLQLVALLCVLPVLLAGGTASVDFPAPLPADAARAVRGDAGQPGGGLPPRQRRPGSAAGRPVLRPDPADAGRRRAATVSAGPWHRGRHAAGQHVRRRPADPAVRGRARPPPLRTGGD